MVVAVEQRLGDVHRGQVQRFRFVTQRDDELVARTPVRIGEFEARVAESRLQVVRVQRRVLRKPPHAVAADHAHVDVCAQEDAGIAHEGRQASDRLRQVGLGQPVVDRLAVLLTRGDHRDRHVRQQALADADRPGTGSTAAMRRREGLVQVHVNDVESHVAGPDLAADRVQIGAVVVQQATGVFHDALDLEDLALEYSQGRRIGEHDARRLRADHCLERLEIDVAVGPGRHFHGDAAAHRRSRGVGTVRGIRHDDLVALQVAVGPMIGPDHRHAGQFALRTGHRRERHTGHAGDGLEHLLQFIHALHESLAVAHRPERMAAGKRRQQRERIADARVVFHRAGTQRVELRVDGKILLRQTRVVAHHLQFGGLRQHRPVVPQMRCRDVLWRDVEGSLGIGSAAFARFLEYQRGHCLQSSSMLMPSARNAAA